MKKNSSILLVFSVLLLLSSCGVATQTHDSAANDTSIKIKNEGEESMSEIDKQKLSEYENKTNKILKKDSKSDYQSLITQTYPEKVFFEKGVLFRDYNPARSFQHYLFTVDEDFPTECFRKTNETSAYSIYKTDEGGVVFLFYENEQSSWILHHSAYVKKNLTDKDFESVKLGDRLEDIIKIDPATEWLKIYLSNDVAEIFSIHLLKDGLIKISYKKDDAGVMIITDIEKHADFKRSLNGVVYDYTILLQDYPQN